MPEALVEFVGTAGLAPTTLAVIALAFLVAGLIKGIAGLGLPLVSLGLMVLVIDFKTAMTLLVAPAILSNVWQALAGSHMASIIRRLRWFLVIGFVVTILIQIISQGWDERSLTTALGLIVMTYTGTVLFTRPISVPSTYEPWLNPIVAVFTGILSGISGAFALPAAVYFQALGLTKDMMVQTLGIWFVVGAVALALGVSQSPSASMPLLALSLVMTLPVLAGMRVGQMVRAKLSEELFRKTLLGALCAIGAWLAFRGVFLSSMITPHP